MTDPAPAGWMWEGGKVRSVQGDCRLGSAGRKAAGPAHMDCVHVPNRRRFTAQRRIGYSVRCPRPVHLNATTVASKMFQ
jgi:hypothetical protein